jgi:hypothetical protein
VGDIAGDGEPTTTFVANVGEYVEGVMNPILLKAF